ncbi:MAG: hypothetical protein A3E84_05515 [Gammaproteobacteria bacterium RIFCSPHIGHO2_12_FULL_42_13]|nr:MAG: hypothetical protein A3E84_05515 [Gammaproteobacteria bacterium RIFCSPHIGHO2_12_FULL_42_13]
MMIGDVHIGHKMMIRIVAFLLSVIFSTTLYSLLRTIPKEKRTFPLWFIWLCLIPDICYIFQLVIMPFAIPKTLRKAFPNHQEAMLLSNKLVHYGSWFIVFAGLSYVAAIFHVHLVTDGLGITAIVFWVLYWLTAMKFRRERQRFIDETKD